MLAPFPEIRRVWARYYDTITQIDYHVCRFRANPTSHSGESYH